MTLSDTLRKLGHAGTYPSIGSVDRRWGQILRESPALREMLQSSRVAGRLIPLVDLAEIRSGVVSRANAYFVVRELPPEQIPAYMRVTRRDLQRIAVVEDGLKKLSKIERLCLKPIVKGPDAILGPRSIASGDQRLFDAVYSRAELKTRRANGALAYLHRGETVDYNVSDDRLKGGIPANRANVRNRRPYWYSLHVPSVGVPRIAVPEHFDSRFVAGLVPSGDEHVVIDTLYSIVPRRSADADVLLMSLNSILTWYQLEMRGRTQHGEGVLKVKVADWERVLVLNPSSLSPAVLEKLSRVFAPLRERDTAVVADEVVDPDRLTFDTEILNVGGCPRPDDARTDLERELRAAMGERHERARSMDDAKVASSAIRRGTISIDAFASRIADDVPAFPDPRAFVSPDAETLTTIVAGSSEGLLTVGDDLFTQGQVLAGGIPIVLTGDVHSAQYVRGVLSQDRSLSSVDVPVGEWLMTALARWDEAVETWRVAFESECQAVTDSLADRRVREQVRQRALVLLGAF